MWERLLGGLAIIVELIIVIACVPVVTGCLVLGLGIFVLVVLSTLCLSPLLIIAAWLRGNCLRHRR